MGIYYFKISWHTRHWPAYYYKYTTEGTAGYRICPCYVHASTLARYAPQYTAAEPATSGKSSNIYQIQCHVIPGFFLQSEIGMEQYFDAFVENGYDDIETVELMDETDIRTRAFFFVCRHANTRTVT